MQWIVKRYQELSLDELYEILRLRCQVFIMEQGAYLDPDRKDQSAYHLFALNEAGEMVAYARILDPGIRYEECSIGRVIVGKAHRGEGLGRELIRRCLAFIKETLGIQVIRISAQARLQQFYQDAGFRPVGKVYQEDDIPHIEMVYGQNLK